MHLLLPQWRPTFLFRQAGDLTASESTVWCDTGLFLCVKIRQTQHMLIFTSWIRPKRQNSDCTTRQMHAGCERWLRLSLDTMLREINQYAFLYKSMRQVFEGEQQKPYLRIENISLLQ